MSNSITRIRISKARSQPASQRGQRRANALSDEERELRDELNRMNPAGAIEADPSDWPADVDNWHWRSNGRPLD